MERKHFPFSYLIGGFLLLILAGGEACASRERSQSLLFQELFQNKKGLFRGNELGDALSDVREREGIPPKHDDLLGLSYYYPLPDSQQLFVEYYTGLPESGLRGDSLNAITANIFLQNEIIAAELYREIQGHFRARMGLSIGEYGEDIWEGESPRGRMEARLRFTEGGRGLSVNFVKKSSL